MVLLLAEYINSSSETIGIQDPGVCFPNLRVFTSPSARMCEEFKPIVWRRTFPLVEAPNPITSKPDSKY